MTLAAGFGRSVQDPEVLTEGDRGEDPNSRRRDRHFMCTVQQTNFVCIVQQTHFMSVFQ